MSEDRKELTDQFLGWEMAERDARYFDSRYPIGATVWIHHASGKQKAEVKSHAFIVGCPGPTAVAYFSGLQGYFGVHDHVYPFFDLPVGERLTVRAHVECPDCMERPGAGRVERTGTEATESLRLFRIKLNDYQELLREQMKAKTGRPPEYLRRLRDVLARAGEIADRLELAEAVAPETLAENRMLAVPGEPIPMILICPNCKTQHIDEPDPENGWDNPPHKSHLCHCCAHIWRPADAPTTGVEAIRTRGKADTWPCCYTCNAPVSGGTICDECTREAQEDV